MKLVEIKDFLKADATRQTAPQPCLQQLQAMAAPAKSYIFWSTCSGADDCIGVFAVFQNNSALGFSSKHAYRLWTPADKRRGTMDMAREITKNAELGSRDVKGCLCKAGVISLKEQGISQQYGQQMVQKCVQTTKSFFSEATVGVVFHGATEEQQASVMAALQQPGRCSSDSLQLTFAKNDQAESLLVFDFTGEFQPQQHYSAKRGVILVRCSQEKNDIAVQLSLYLSQEIDPAQIKTRMSSGAWSDASMLNSLATLIVNMALKVKSQERLFGDYERHIQEEYQNSVQKNKK